MPSPQFMAPLVSWLVGVLESAELGELSAFAEVKQSWTGVVMNWPPAWKALRRAIIKCPTSDGAR